MLVRLVSDTAAIGVAEGDELLVQRLRGGDATAGDELVRRHCQPMLRYLNRLTGSQHLAEELYQQTWLSVLEHLDRFQPDSANSSGFRAWLFRIATNKALDVWRSGSREKAAHRGLIRITEQEGPDSSQRLESMEMDGELRRAIEQLPDNQRQVLLLRYYSNLKFTEIAELLGCPLNTALGRMHKALIRLKQLMVAEDG
jgi:RNA polymerase sigma-70 factor (ECF subfamily)